MYLPRISRNRAEPCLFLILFLILASPVPAQVGSDTGHWNWTPAAEHHDAVVKIETENGSGTGVLVHVFKTKPVANGFEGLCLTAWHVVSDDQAARRIKVKYRNGKRARRCRVVSWNERLDVALLRVWVPKEVPPVLIAESEVSVGDKLEYCGLGGASPLNMLRHFRSVAESPTTSEQVFSSVPLLPGDSGGPVFNGSGRVVGIISGGWFWFDGGVTSQNGNRVRATWPARSSNLEPIAELLRQALANKPVVASQ